MRSITPRLRLSLLALAAAAALSLTGCATTPDASPQAPTSEGSTSQPDAGTCAYPDSGREASKAVDAPASEPTVTGDVPATITTNIGALAVTLDADTTPCTVNSFLSLAEQGYFADTTCHRLTTQGIFVLQCGDPSGTGAGGPGYSFADELSGSETYGAGTLAMANAGPNTNGSQFFIVYAGTQLPPNYTVFGQLDHDSTALVAELAAEGTANGAPDGAPKNPVTIESVTTN